jgi:hypothetical protein
MIGGGSDLTAGALKTYPFTAPENGGIVNFRFAHTGGVGDNVFQFLNASNTVVFQFVLTNGDNVYPMRFDGVRWSDGTDSGFGNGANGPGPITQIQTVKNTLDKMHFWYWT